MTNTVEFRTYLKEQIDKAGYSIRELGRRTGVNHSYISKILSGEKTNPPSAEILKKLSEHLPCRHINLMIKAGYISLVNVDEEKGELILEDNVKSNDSFVHETRRDYEKEIEILPVLGYIAAGQPLYAEEHIIDYKKVPYETVKNGEFFYLKVTGDSMINAGIQEGDLVLVKRQPDVENKQIAVVMVNVDEATVKRVYKSNNQLILHPENPKYDPIVVENREARIIGRVIALTREF